MTARHLLFLFYVIKMYICAFISQRSVIIYTALWFPPVFCGIKFVSGHIIDQEAKFLHTILLVYYNGFLSQQKDKDTQDPASISD